MFEIPLLIIKVMILCSLTLVGIFCVLEVYSRLSKTDWEKLAEQQTIRLLKTNDNKSNKNSNFQEDNDVSCREI